MIGVIIGGAVIASAVNSAKKQERKNEIIWNLIQEKELKVFNAKTFTEYFSKKDKISLSDVHFALEHFKENGLLSRVKERLKPYYEAHYCLPEYQDEVNELIYWEEHPNEKILKMVKNGEITTEMGILLQLQVNGNVDKDLMNKVLAGQQLNNLYSAATLVTLMK